MRTQFGELHLQRTGKGKGFSNYNKGGGKYHNKNKSRFHAYLEETAEDETIEFPYEGAGGDEDECYDKAAYYEDAEISEYGGDMD